LVVVASQTAGRWLKASADVFIAVELPFAGAFEPRVLECAATISRVRSFSNGVRIAAKVNRMAVIGRSPEARARSRAAAHSYAAGTVPAVERPQNDNPVIRMNHSTNLNTNPTGENTMSFLKNFFVEEDGQDMVEYGLVIALVVAGGAGIYTAFSTQLTTAFTTLGGKVNSAL
jgi:Flp pilus assembly pilin Flp